MSSSLFRWTGLVALVALVALNGSLVQAAEFDCHVILDNNAVHIARVEAPDRNSASSLAAHVRVKTGGKAAGKSVGVRQVRQCALRHSESLSDPTAESQRKAKPL